MHNVLAHVGKNCLVPVQSDARSCWLKLGFVTSTYTKCKRSKLVSYGIFYVNKVCSYKILTC